MLIDEIELGVDRVNLPLFKNAVEKSVVVKIQNIATYFWETTAKEEWALEDFPCCLSPWTNAFLIWRQPKNVLNSNGFQEMPLHSFAMAAGITRVSVEQFKTMEVESMVNGSLVTWPPNDERIKYITTVVIFHGLSGLPNPVMEESFSLDAMGNILKDPGVIAYTFGTPSNIDNKSLLAFRTTGRDPALLALSLANCKNVVIEKEMVGKGLIKKRQKSGKINISRYHTIVIEPIRKMISSKNSGNAEISPRSLSLMRGHFKNFNEGKGLFGKIHGLFFWEQCLRGNKNKGVIKKDYEISI